MHMARWSPALSLALVVAVVAACAGSADTESPDGNPSMTTRADALQPTDGHPALVQVGTRPQDRRRPSDGPAMGDWDGRHYDFGTAKGASRVPGGYIVEWDRSRLLLATPPGFNEIRHSRAPLNGPVEPSGAIIGLRDSAVVNAVDQSRPLTITDSAWVYRVDQQLARCGHGSTNRPLPWKRGSLEDWIGNLPSRALLTFDAAGRVVQIRPAAEC